MTRAIYSYDIPDEVHIAQIMERNGMPEDEARFVLALERGEISGDMTLLEGD
jgi:hypothetical protein